MRRDRQREERRERRRKSRFQKEQGRFDRTARYTTDRDRRDKGYLKAAGLLAGAGAAVFALRDPNIRGNILQKLTRTAQRVSGSLDNPRVIRTEAIHLAEDIAGQSIKRARWARGVAASNLANRRLADAAKTGELQSLRSAGITQLTDTEARGLAEVTSGIFSRNVNGQQSELVLDAIQFRKGVEQGENATAIIAELTNRIAGNKNLGRVRELFAQSDTAQRAELLRDLVRMDQGLVSEGFGAGVDTLQREARKVDKAYLKSATAALRKRLALGTETAQAAERHGLHQVTLDDYLTREYNRLNNSDLSWDEIQKKVSSAAQAHTARADPASYDIYDVRFHSLVETQKAVFGDNLGAISAGTDVYQTAAGELVNIGEAKSALVSARMWADRAFHIPVAGISPTRMGPWIPRSRQDRIRFLHQPDLKQYGYQDIGSGVFQLGQDTKRIVKSGDRYVAEDIGEFIAAERHGMFMRTVEAFENATIERNRGFLTAEGFREAAANLTFESAWGPQPAPSIVGEIRDFFMRDKDPDFAPTAFKMLQEAAEGTRQVSDLDIRRGLQLVVDTIDQDALADVSVYNEIILKAFGDQLSDETRGLLVRGANTRGARVRALNELTEQIGSGEASYGQGVVELAQYWGGTGSMSTTSSQVRTDNPLGILIKDARSTTVYEDQVVFQRLGKLAIEELTSVPSPIGGRSQSLNIAEMGDLMETLSPESQRLVQSEAISSYLRGRGVVFDQNLNMQTPVGFGSELSFVRAMHGVEDTGELGYETFKSVFNVLDDTGQIQSRRPQLHDYLEKRGRWSFSQVDVHESGPTTGDPLLIRQSQFGGWLDLIQHPQTIINNWRQIGREAMAGIHDVENITNLTMVPWALTERLSPLGYTIGLGLGSNDIARGAPGILTAIGTKRVLPLVTGGYGISYLNYQSEKGDKAGEGGSEGLADTVFAARRGFSRTVIGVQEILGVRDINRDISRDVAGFANIQELPFIGGLFDTDTVEEYNRETTEGYSAVRSGRWWLTGSRQPIIGGRIKAWLPNIHRRMESDWQEVAPGLTPEEYWAQSPLPVPENFFLGPLTHYIQNYAFEQKASSSRPYPESSPAFTERHFIGGLLNATIGPIIKPKRYHEHYDRGSGFDVREVRAAQRYLAGKSYDERFISGNLLLQHVQQGTIPEDSAVGSLAGYPTYSTTELMGDTGTTKFKKGLRYDLTPRRLGSGGGGGGYANYGEGDGGFRGHSAGGDYAPREATYDEDSYDDDEGDYAGQEGDPVAKRVRSLYFKNKVAGPPRLSPSVRDFPSELRSMHNIVTHASILGKSAEDLAGIYGFATTATAEKFGIDRSRTQAQYEIANPEMAMSPAESYWRSEFGGLPSEDLGSELGRRFVPRRSGRQKVWNPIRNEMPDWLPGPEGFRDFLHGDPYVQTMGAEYLLPGKARDAIFGPAELSISNITSSNVGNSVEEMVGQILGRTGYDRINSDTDDTVVGSAIHAAYQNLWKEKGMLIAAEVYTRTSDISGLADAIVQTPNGPMVTEIKTKSQEVFDQMTEPDAKHVSQLNFYLHSLDAPTGIILYTSRENPHLTKQFYINRDTELFMDDVRRIRQAQSIVKDMLQSGQVSEYDLYNDFEKFRTLALVAPFSDEYRFMEKKLLAERRANYEAGSNLGDESNWEEVKQLRRMVKQQRVKKELYPYAQVNSEAQTFVATIGSIHSAGTFTLKGDKSGTLYQLAGIDMDLLRMEYGRQVPFDSDESESAAKAALQELGLVSGAKVTLTTDNLRHLTKTGRDMISASVVVKGKNISREMVKQNFTEYENDWTAPSRAVMGVKRSLTAQAIERTLHMDTMFHTKLSNVRTASEEWDRSYVYGAQYGTWDSPIRDYVMPMTWSLGGRGPLASTLRGAFLFAPFTGKQDWHLLQEAWKSTKHLQGVERIKPFLSEYIFPQAAKEGKTTWSKIFRSMSGAKVGAILGFASWAYGKAKSGVTADPMPSVRRKQYEGEEYWDKVKYVKHTKLYESYMHQAKQREREVIEQLYNSPNVDPIDIMEALELFEKKWKRWQDDHQDSEIRSINTEITGLTGLNTAERMGVFLSRANLHRSAASRTAYGADPNKSSQVIGGMPDQARQVLVAGEKTQKDRDRIWKTLPKYLKESMWAYYGKKPIGKQSLVDYFQKHSLPDEHWAGWDEDVDLRDLRNLYMYENNPGLNPMEYGVWTQTLAETRKRVGDIPLPRMRSRSDGSDVRHTLRRLFKGANMDVEHVRLTARTGTMDVEVTRDQTEDYIQEL